MQNEIYRIVVKVENSPSMPKCLKIIKKFCPEKSLSQLKQAVILKEAVWDYELFKNDHLHRVQGVLSLVNELRKEGCELGIWEATEKDFNLDDKYKLDYDSFMNLTSKLEQEEKDW